MLKNSLSISWPNLSKGQLRNEDFWKYEWQQHGICSYDSFNQTQYFQLAYGIWSRDDLVGILGHGPQGISPQVNVYYHPDKFATPIMTHIGASPELHCTDNGELLEIKLCLDHSGSNYMSCPTRGNCYAYKFKRRILWQP
jgi:ribonuclease I